MDAVRSLWARQIEAEYTSAAKTAELVHWLIVVGAPADLITRGSTIVADEIAHAELSRDVLAAAGGDPDAVALDARRLVLPHDAGAPVLHRALSVVSQAFCCGESVAVPLFLEIRARASEPAVQPVLDRICRDEATHRAFGWDALDALLDLAGPDGVGWLRDRVPGFVAGIVDHYSGGPQGDWPAAREAWGVMRPQRYGAIAARCADEVLLPRFAARDLVPQGLTLDDCRAMQAPA